jgi:L-asparagine transporter-like permease
MPFRSRKALAEKTRQELKATRIAHVVLAALIITACVANYLRHPNWFSLIYNGAGMLFILGWLVIAIRQIASELGRRRSISS